MTLSELRPGQKGQILSVDSARGASGRIVEMGLSPGSIVEVERVAPLGDPIDVKVRGHHLSIRREEAASVAVELK